jgi:hypothetical protein
MLLFLSEVKKYLMRVRNSNSQSSTVIVKTHYYLYQVGAEYRAFFRCFHRHLKKNEVKDFRHLCVSRVETYTVSTGNNQLIEAFLDATNQQMIRTKAIVTKLQIRIHSPKN